MVIFKHSDWLRQNFKLNFHDSANSEFFNKYLGKRLLLQFLKTVSSICSAKYYLPSYLCHCKSLKCHLGRRRLGELM